MKIRVKISEYDASRAAAKQPLAVLDTIEVEASATSSLDERKALAKAKAIEHAKRPFRSIQHAKLAGGRDGFTVIVGKKG